MTKPDTSKLACLEIGGGSKPRSGFEQLDHKHKKGPFDLMLDDLPKNRWDYIYMSHVLEHIPVEFALPVMKKVHEALKSGGTLRIIVPDLEEMAWAYLHDDKELFSKSVGRTPSTNWLGVGGQFVGNIISPGSDTYLYARDRETPLCGRAHQMAYDYDMLKLLLDRAGFHFIRETDLVEWDTWYPKPLQLCVEAGK